MATISINDLPASRNLDRKSLSFVCGAGAGWVFGWISPYVAKAAAAASVINLYQFNNFGGQMNNQIQIVDVTNSGIGASINVLPGQLGVNANGI
jgi:hypothetical protein